MFDALVYAQLKHGDERFKYLKKLIEEEDNAHNYAEAFDLRYKYIQESVIYGDCFKGTIMFPEFMAYYDAHSDVCDRHSLMWAFKWMIEDTIDFYQISIEKIDQYFEEFRRRCELYGLSLRTYYKKKRLFYKYVDPSKLEECKSMALQYPRDEISDCNACEKSADMRDELEFGSEKKAMEMLADMLRQGVKCAHVPHNAFGECVRHFTETGNLAEAAHYAELFMPMIKGKEENFLEDIAHVLLLKARTDPNEAYKIFERSVNIYLESKNPVCRLFYANAAAKFFDAALQAGHKHIIIKLPHSFPLYNEENEYELEAMRDHFAGIAQELADKFDKRNGSSYFNDHISFEYPDEPTGDLELPEHSTVPAVPAAIAVLYKSGETFPEPQSIVDVFEAMPDMKIAGVSADQEDGVLNISVENSKLQETLEFRLFFRGADGVADIRPVHLIPEEKLEDAADYETMIVITCKLIKGCVQECYNILLAAAYALNTDDSPVFADLENSKLLSADWVHIQAEDAMPVPEKYFYKINVYRSEDQEDRFDMLTTGLSQFGSRELMVECIGESDIDFAGDIISQIAKYIICLRNMPDENEPMPFGVIFGGESNIRFSWQPAKKIDPELADSENGLGEYAVPFLHYADGEAFLVGDFPEQDRDELNFREFGSHYRNEELSSKVRYPRALDAFKEKGSELIVGVELPVPEELEEVINDDMAYVYLSLGEDGTTGTITRGYDDTEQFAQGKTMSVDPETVFFWRLTIDDEFYFADDAYLLT